MKLLPEEDAIDEAVETLEKGGLVVYPTDTAYGIGADATNPDAVSRLLKFKGNRTRPISVMVSSRRMAEEYVHITETGSYAYSFFPGKLTVISENLGKVDPRIASGTLGIRIPGRSFCLELASRLGRPITSTSANPTGMKTPFSMHDVLQLPSDVLGLVDIAIDAGKLGAMASTVVKAIDRLEIIREGEILKRNEKEFVSESIYDTENFASMFKPPVLIALEGGLGAGKTAFAKAFGRRYGLELLSPTFTLSHEYNIPSGTLYHVDAYRMNSWHELVEIGFDSMIRDGNAVIIEWADRVSKPIREHVLDFPSLWITIEIDERLEDGKRIFKYTSEFL